MGAARTNITPALSRFVGREGELAKIGERFGSGERLVTVVGAAGMGKTTLARRYAGRDDAEGVWFCDLTEAHDVDSICEVVRGVLEVPSDDRGRAVDQLAEVLRARGRTLLVLDNFEQIVEHAPATVGTWLAGCPEVRLLVTSRARLALPGENIVQLGPLAIGDSIECEAVELLIDRVSRIRRDAAFTDDDHARLSTIVGQLDGIPLAIELAAPRVAFLGTKTFLELLDARFSILTGSARGTRGLRDALDWSWDLLSEAERAVFAQCSIFRGGFDFDAAREVIAIDPGESSLLDALQSLHDQSLLIVDRTPDARFNIYLSLREFGAEKLSAMGIASDVAARHAHYYAVAGSRRAQSATGPDWRNAYGWLARERENLKAAAEGRGSANDTLVAALALEPFMMLDHSAEAYEAILSRAMVLADASVDPELRAEALIVRAAFRRHVGRLDLARADLEQARREASTPALVGRAVAGLGRSELACGELTKAAALLEEAIALFVETGDRVQEATARGSYATVLYGFGELERAREFAEEAAALHTRAQNWRDAGRETSFLATLRLEAGEFDEARALLTQAEALHQRVGDRFGLAFAEGSRAALTHRAGLAAAAIPLYESSIAAFRAIGVRRYAGAFGGYRALALEEIGRIDEARAALIAACAELDDTRDQLMQAMFGAHLARFTASAGDFTRAEREIERARRRLATSQNRFVRLSIDLCAAAIDAMRGRSLENAGDPRGAALIASARAFLRHAYEGEGRAPIEESLEVTLAVHAFERLVGERSETIANDVLVVRWDGASFRTAGVGEVSLERRVLLQALLLALARGHRDRRGAAMSHRTLIAASWPDERVIRRSASNRLRVAIATLRRLGLRDAILTRPDGYLLDPSIDVVIEEAPH